MVQSHIAPNSGGFSSSQITGAHPKKGPITNTFASSGHLADLDALTALIQNARSATFSSDIRIDRDQANALLARLRKSLPVAIGQADELLRKADAEFAAAQDGAALLRTDAHNQAEELLTSTQAQVDELRAAANTEVAELRSAAQAEIAQQQAISEADIEQRRNRAIAEAESILEAARTRAAELIDEETVVAQAKAQAASILSEATTNAHQLRTDADLYCDERLAALGNELMQVSARVNATISQVEAGRDRLKSRLS